MNIFGLFKLACAAGLYSLVLTGCGPSVPSKSEAKTVVEHVFANCPLVQIGNFSKVNGIAQQDGSYLVSVKFTVKISPIPENIETYNTAAKLFIAQHDAYKQWDLKEIPQFQEDKRKLEDMQYHANSEQEKANFGAQIDALSDAYGKKWKYWDNYQKSIPKGVLAEQKQRFFKACQLPDFYRDLENRKMAINLIAPMLSADPYDHVMAKEPYDQFAKELESEYTANLSMIKSENGWIQQ